MDDTLAIAGMVQSQSCLGSSMNRILVSMYAALMVMLSSSCSFGVFVRVSVIVQQPNDRVPLTSL